MKFFFFLRHEISKIQPDPCGLVSTHVMGWVWFKNPYTRPMHTSYSDFNTDNATNTINFQLFYNLLRWQIMINAISLFLGLPLTSFLLNMVTSTMVKHIKFVVLLDLLFQHQLEDIILSHKTWLQAQNSIVIL